MPAILIIWPFSDGFWDAAKTARHSLPALLGCAVFWLSIYFAFKGSTEGDIESSPDLASQVVEGISDGIRNSLTFYIAFFFAVLIILEAFGGFSLIAIILMVAIGWFIASRTIFK